MPDYFIDSHCHMFTMADVPLYRSIFQLIDDKDKIHKRILFPFAGIVLPFVNLEKVLKENERYIQFFEHEAKENVVQLASEVQQSVDAAGSPYGGRTIILTPLIMDFDIGGEVNKLNAQIQRLVDAISAANLDSNRIKILPFLGIDPRRSNALAKVDKYDSLKNRTSPAILSSGSFIGIKLYPPLGFDVSGHLDFYSGLNDRQLPITVHCQRDSFRLTPKALEYTDPKKWETVLEQLPGLRINFAHFGGEDAVAATVRFRARNDGEPTYPEVFDGIEEKTFTYRIIRMLKAYPNAFADVSAFDVTNTRAVVALLWLLNLDRNNELGVKGDYMLEDKLLWGSDYPMVLGDKESSYTTIFNGFAASLERTQHDEGYYQLPSPLNLDAEALMEKMVNDNPRKFLNV